MATRTGAGYSNADAAWDAGRAAADQALAALGRDRTDLVLVFASSRYAYQPLLAGVRSLIGSAPLVGCSSAGEFTHQKIGHESVAVMLITSDDLRFKVGLGTGLKSDQGAAVTLALQGHDSEARAARAEGLPHTTLMVLADGLAGRGENLVDAIHMRAPLAQIVGGAAADQARFERTDVFYNDQHHTDALVVARIYSKVPIAVGVAHGLKSGSPPLVVTKAEGNVVQEIDGKPAIHAYERFAQQRGRSFSGSEREAFMMVHELGMLTPSGHYKIRAPLKANPDGSLMMASEVPAGASCAIMEGTNEGLVSAAESAARAALTNLGVARPAGVLSFDCICRRIFLGGEYRQQVDAFRKVVGRNVPIVGWETYGEIALTPNQHSGWHNSTSVVAILPA
jgi:methyl-accepting chemotaxis protein